MGGLAGHTPHLYENQSLRFSEMKEIFEAAASGKLEAEEKDDGVNLFISYSIEKRKTVAARNLSNIRTGGLDAVSMGSKFAGHPAESVFVPGFKAFEAAIESLEDKTISDIFGADANIWYNTEIMSPTHPNIVVYDKDIIKIHDTGHVKREEETGNPIAYDASGHLQILDQVLNKMQASLSSEGDYLLARRAVIHMTSMTDKGIVREAVRNLDATIKSVGMSDNSTILEYMVARLTQELPNDWISEETRDKVVGRLLKVQGFQNLRDIKRDQSPEQKEEISNIMSSQRGLLKKAIEPVEMIVHNFAVDILKEVGSIFVMDNSKEAARIREELLASVAEMRELAKNGQIGDDAIGVMNRELAKIAGPNKEDENRITTALEGIMFDWNGTVYKFTGNFAPVNQIIGMSRRNPARINKNAPKTNESLQFIDRLIEAVITGTNTDPKPNGKVIALVPGGFKPPHAGHYKLAEYFSNMKNVDEVRVIIGSKVRCDKIEGQMCVTPEKSKRIWDLYVRASGDKKIIVTSQTSKSPISDIYDLVSNPEVFKKGDTAILGRSEKEAVTPFKTIESHIERNNPGVIIEDVVTPMFAEGVSGTDVRNLIASNMKEEFFSHLPEFLTPTDLEAVWEIIEPPALEETSTMGAGAVEGGSSTGFGPPNTYDVYNTMSAPKKRTVNRRTTRRR